jgi:hypothetical protein
VRGRRGRRQRDLPNHSVHLPEGRNQRDLATEQRADHITGQPTRIAVPVLIDVLTAYLIGALRKCETYAERQQ